MKRFSDLTEQEILALAISLEEEHARIYADYADGLKERYPHSAGVFEAMVDEENTHRRWLIDTYAERFGDHIPLIRRQDIRGMVAHKPLWQVRPLGLDAVRKQAEEMEYEIRNFYERALERTTDTGIRKLLGDLVEAERKHESLASQLNEDLQSSGAVDEEAETAKRMFVLQIVQPGLAGVDGRLGLNAGAPVCGGLRHAKHVGNISGWHGRFGRCRNFHGVCGGAVR